MADPQKRTAFWVAEEFPHTAEGRGLASRIAGRIALPTDTGVVAYPVSVMAPCHEPRARLRVVFRPPGGGIGSSARRDVEAASHGSRRQP